MHTMETTAAIKPGVYFGLVENFGVAMDLTGDRYFGLSDWSVRVWTQLQRGVPIARIADEIAAEESVTAEEALDMIARQLDAWRTSGLLLTDTADGTVFEVPEIRSAGAPAAIALELDRVQRVPLAASAILRFAAASAQTALMLRRHGLPWTLKRLQAISTKYHTFHDAETRVMPMARAYVAVRRPFRQGQLDCLPRSVALALSLRRLGVDAQVCFGARAIPFTAHAWVEVDGVAVNEKLDKLQGFTVLARF